MKRVVGIVPLGMALAIAACGGTSSKAALEHRVGDRYLAPVPIEDRGALREAARAVFLAEWQIRFTEQELRSAQLEVKTASNRVKSSKLEAKSIRLEKKRATDVASEERLASADARQQSTEAQIAADRAHQAEAKQRLGYLRARLDAERHALRSAEAELELLKARSMTSAGIRPPKFDLDRYQNQRNDRRAQLERAKTKVAQEKTSLDALTVQRKNAEAALQRLAPVAAPVPDAPPTMNGEQKPIEKAPPLKKAPPPPEEPVSPPPPTVAPLTDEGEDASESDSTPPGGESDVGSDDGEEE